MVARYLGVVEAVGSSPATQTIKTTLQASFFSLLAGLEGRGTENSTVCCSTAPPLCPQAGKSRHSDQIKPKTNRFRLYFFAFSGQNRAFSHHFRTTRNSENFLTTYLTTVGAGAIRLVASVPAGLRKLNSSKVPGNILSENLFLCFLRISFYPYILFIIEKYHVLCYNMAVQLLIPYRTCHCKRHFIEKRRSRPLFIGAYGVAKIQV